MRLGWVARISQEGGHGESEHKETLGAEDRNKPSRRRFLAQKMWDPLNGEGGKPRRALDVWQDDGAGLYPISSWGGWRLSLVLSTQKGDLVLPYNSRTNPLDSGEPD